MANSKTHQLHYCIFFSGGHVIAVCLLQSFLHELSHQCFSSASFLILPFSGSGPGRMLIAIHMFCGEISQFHSVVPTRPLALHFGDSSLNFCLISEMGMVPSIFKNWYPIFQLIAGWWFGCHFFFSHILGIIIPMDFHIFQRGGPTTHQQWIASREERIPGFFPWRNSHGFSRV